MCLVDDRFRQRHAPANRFLVVAFHKTYGGCLER